MKDTFFFYTHFHGKEVVPKSTLLETVVKVLKISTEIYGQSVLERPIYKVNILELRKEKFYYEALWLSQDKYIRAALRQRHYRNTKLLYF